MKAENVAGEGNNERVKELRMMLLRWVTNKNNLRFSTALMRPFSSRVHEGPTERSGPRNIRKIFLLQEIDVIM